MPLTKATQNVVEGIVSTGSAGVSAGSFQVGQQYKITSLGTTTQSQWNTIAGTTGKTYVVGSLFTAATDGASSGNGAAAVARTLANRFADVVNVKDFGAVGDGVTDDTAAIQAAIDYAEGEVYFPVGNYKISSSLNINNNSIRLVGSSRYSTLITQTTLNSKIVNISTSSYFCGIEHLSFRYQGTPASGATAIFCGGSYCTLKDFVVRNAYIGVEWYQGVAGKASDFEILDYENIGLYVHELNDLMVSRFIMNAGNTTRGASGGICLEENVEAFICSDGDILLGQYSMTMVVPVFAIGRRPAYNNFTNVFFDSAANGTRIYRCVETEFVGCWFSNGRVGPNTAGALLDGCQSITFTNCRYFNNGGNGVSVLSTTSDITFTACKANSNSVTVGAGVAHGFYFDDNCTQFQVIGCTSSNGLFSGQQGYGIFIGVNCNQFVVRDCNLIGNLTGPLSDNSSINADKTIHGNIGYRTSNTGSGTILAGTTSIVVSHGLSLTPNLQDIVLTRQSTNAGSTDLYVSNITSTQFTINTFAAPSVNSTITWMARCSGA
jgi:hypothetical protein